MIIAPIEYFSSRLDRSSGVVAGYAAPKSGYGPSLIHIYSNKRILAAVDATAYAGDGCEYRLGWCGFTLRLDAEMFLFSDEIELVCGISGRSLLTIASNQVSQDLLNRAEVFPKLATIERLAREDPTPISASGVARLIHAIAIDNSAELAAHVLYQLILGRSADYEGLLTAIPKMESLESIHLRIIDMLNSEEFANLPIEKYFRTPYQDRIPFEIPITIARAPSKLTATLSQVHETKLEHSFTQQDAADGSDMDIFNAAWYAHYYRDVVQSGMDPAEHFRWIGQRLNRAPNANALIGRAR